jgi:hypothetical protein
MGAPVAGLFYPKIHSIRGKRTDCSCPCKAARARDFDVARSVCVTRAGVSLAGSAASRLTRELSGRALSALLVSVGAGVERRYLDLRRAHALNMAYYQDLATLSLFGETKLPALAIGWLDPAHDYRRGAVSPKFFESLISLLVDPWQPAVAAGVHRCAFCRFTGGPAELRYSGMTARLGAANLFVPSDQQLLIAPSLIAHYIDAHAYAPPPEFQEAVQRCPPMKSMQYLRLIKERRQRTSNRSGRSFERSSFPADMTREQAFDVWFKNRGRVTCTTTMAGSSATAAAAGCHRRGVAGRFTSPASLRQSDKPWVSCR